MSARLKKYLSNSGLSLVTLMAATASADGPHILTLDAPIATWDEGLPLGNGLIGALVWGTGNTINISIDRGDLWDLRTPKEFSRADWNYATLKKAVADHNERLVNELTDDSYNHPWPTKLPCGRLQVRLPLGFAAKSFSLDLATAQASVAAGTSPIDVRVDANQPIVWLRLPLGSSLELVPPSAVSQLGYPPALRSGFGDLQWYSQECAEGLSFAVLTVAKQVGDHLVVALTVEAARKGLDPVSPAKRRVLAALDTEKASAVKHRAWWAKFWKTSSVTVPNEHLQRHYDFVKYLYGAGSRRGAPPIPLQGIWTADGGTLPPWKGDLHNDLNTQMTYIAYPAAGLFDAGLSWLDLNIANLPRYREFATKFFGVPGAVVPGVMDLEGKPLGGWGQYSFSPTNGAWIADQFYRHWRYTLDDAFLKSKAYPFCSEIGSALAALLDDRGKLPLSTSPEIGDNSQRAWLKPNSNYDQALMVRLFTDLAEMARSLGRAGDVARWEGILRKLGTKYELDNKGGLAFAAGEFYTESHRHFSHAMAIHPLGLLDPLAQSDKAIIDPTVATLKQGGTAWWTGYSFSWFACMLARTGDGDSALRYLTDYERAFTLRNGFHCNGDQSGEHLSNFDYRPFTLEGNFLAMEAVHEMLLRKENDVLRVFPAMPASWQDASFKDLRAEGGFKVSARRVGGRTVEVSVTAVRGNQFGKEDASTLMLRDPFAGKGSWSKLPHVDGDMLTWRMRKGERLTGGL